MQLLKAKTPRIFKKMFPDYIWEMPLKKSKDKILYLTFDDGPTPKITNQVLDILKQYNAKATFFCIGKNIEEHSEIFKQVVSNGHAVGNHTFNHLKGWKTNNKDYIEDTLKAEKLIQNFDLLSKISDNSAFITHNSKLFRPPYGKLKPSQGKALQKLGYKIIMWDVLPYDWDTNNTKEKVLNNTIDNVKSGSVVAFHDSKKAASNMLYVLPKMLKYFSEKGYEFKKIEEI